MDFDLIGFVDRLQSKAKSAAEVEQYDAEEARKAKERMGGILAEWQVPKRIRVTLDRPDTTRACEIVGEWMARGEESWCLVLSADKGLGKSTAAGWWLAQVAKGAEPATSPTKRWWPAAEIAALDFYGEDFDRVCRVPSLVLDDLGVEYNDVKGAFQAKLDRLLDARYREYRRTVITTNLGGRAFAERYGERVVDRLREGAVWQTVVGQSMRRGAA